MDTIVEAAKKGIAADVVRRTSELEKVSADILVRGLARGTLIVPSNRTRELRRPIAIGEGVSVKINANIGSSEDLESSEGELEKLKVAVSHGAHTVMDLSTGPEWKSILGRILDRSPVPVGTVPLYQVFGQAMRDGRDCGDVTAEEIFAAVEDHCGMGVDYLTLHCGVTQRAVQLLKEQGRKLGIVSRGGSLMAEWMEKNGAENPLYSEFDRLIEILHEYDVTFSLGDGLRPGCLSDASDRAQIEELISLGELQSRSHSAGVQVMIEGPGHVQMDKIEENVRMQKSLCNSAPFYVLGPIVTDIAPGYDHITSAIGGAMAAWYGADFLCYVTPAEHLRLPDADDVKVGVISARIAAHAADIARGLPGAEEPDRLMAEARDSFDWEKQYSLAMDPVTARKERDEALPSDSDVCSMCGHLCALKTTKRAFQEKREKREK
ncbi:MAG: phosphomethylpyrimidine synthase ThiC [Candidatus Aegiribacteria sp.]|nr:phosphomethylpyrimidine synthase ThiC [Candidatus Aegiribacteria sp.]MBD3295201.1 phosphomethylpyrimidine synthase ThiC [Candidatus Fermentibacteria bacterium]